MIQGLHADIPGTELKEILTSRVDFHTKKVDAYKGQLAELDKIDAVMRQEAESIGKTSTKTPRESIASAVQKHDDSRSYFKFLANHVVDAEVYRLTNSDLVEIGVKANHY